MRRTHLRTLLSALAPVLLLATAAAQAQSAPPATSPTPAPAPIAIDLDHFAPGPPPSQIFVIEGDFTIKASPADDHHHFLQLAGQPLANGAALIGPATTGSAIVRARITARKSGRTYPLLGVGLHGQGGYRLLLQPAKKELQLIRNDQTLATAPYTTWTSDQPVYLQLSVQKLGSAASGAPWQITGKAWPADQPEPNAPQIDHPDANFHGQGKASLWGTPYSGQPIDFDNIEVRVQR